MNLEYLTEQSVIDWLAATGTHHVSLGITARHPEKDASQPLTLPAVVVQATREAEEIIGSGVWRLKVNITLLAQADDTAEATLTSEFANLQEILGWDALAARMSDLSGFHCYGVIRNADGEKTRYERHWQQSYSFTAFCMPMD